MEGLANESFMILVPDTQKSFYCYGCQRKNVLTIKWGTEYWFYSSSLYTYILDTESLDFIVSKRYQLSQGYDEVAPSIKGLVHIVRPVLLTFTLKDG